MLKEHNKEAFEKVKKMFEESKKAAVVQPPGTGKSFIALKWIEENQDKKIIFLAPSFSILLQLQEHMASCGYQLENFKNLKLMTYAKLMEDAKNNEIPQVDGIILDEFHRCGAPEWGKGVESLLEENENAQVLGLSATPIRYLDQNRDMSDEIFDGKVASCMDLTEAIARGILKMPPYIAGIYNLEKDIKRIELKIEKINDKEVQKESKELLEKARRSLEKAKGMDQIFSENIQKKNSKIIVFCKDKKHLEEMMLQTEKWFSKINQNIDTYSVYYDKPKKELELHNFYNNENNHLKVLYCIDILNEGVHIPNVDTIIMTRPTISPIIFLQQLGRGLAVGNENAKIFDMVNNIKSIKDMRAFREKVEKKSKELIEEGIIKETLDLGSFQILENAVGIIESLETIEAILQTNTSKEEQIRLVEEFYQEHQRLPKYGETSALENKLGEFLNRIKYGRTKVTEEQLRRIEVIGFQKEVKDRESEKEEQIRLVEKFYQEHQRLPFKTKLSKEENKLGRFLSRIRYGKAKITEEQMKRLEALGFRMEVKDKEVEKEEKIKLIEEFYQEQQRLPGPTEISKEGITIGVFLNSIKSGHTKIMEEQRRRLEALGFQMGVKDREAEKEEQIRLVEEFYQEHQRLPKERETAKEGIAIGAFLRNIKSGNTKITEEQRRRLEALGFQKQVKDREYEKEEKIRLIEEFYQDHQRLPVQTEISKEGVAIGAFLKNVKYGYTKITEEQLKRLEAIGLQKGVKDKQVEKQELQNLKQELLNEINHVEENKIKK